KQLKDHLRNLSELLAGLNDTGEVLKCHDRMEAIRQRLEGFRTRQILICAAIGGVTGIVLVLIEGGPLIRDTFFSKAPPANGPQPTPMMPLQSQSPTNAEAEPEPSSSTSTASP